MSNQSGANPTPNLLLGEECCNILKDGRIIPFPEPCYSHKNHWELLLREMMWMAVDFHEERKWKVSAARRLAHLVKKKWRNRLCDQQQFMTSQKIASIQSFWIGIADQVKPSIVPEHLQPFAMVIPYETPTEEKLQAARAADVQRISNGMFSKHSQQQEARKHSEAKDLSRSLSWRSSFFPKITEKLHTYCYEMMRNRYAMTFEGSSPLEDQLVSSDSAVSQPSSCGSDMSDINHEEEISSPNDILSIEVVPPAPLWSDLGVAGIGFKDMDAVNDAREAAVEIAYHRFQAQGAIILPVELRPPDPDLDVMNLQGLTLSETDQNTLFLSLYISSCEGLGRYIGQTRRMEGIRSSESTSSLPQDTAQRGPLELLGAKKRGGRRKSLKEGSAAASQSELPPHLQQYPSADATTGTAMPKKDDADWDPSEIALINDLVELYTGFTEEELLLTSSSALNENRLSSRVNWGLISLAVTNSIGASGKPHRNRSGEHCKAQWLRSRWLRQSLPFKLSSLSSLEAPYRVKIYSSAPITLYSMSLPRVPSFMPLIPFSISSVMRWDASESKRFAKVSELPLKEPLATHEDGILFSKKRVLKHHMNMKKRRRIGSVSGEKAVNNAPSEVELLHTHHFSEDEAFVIKELATSAASSQAEDGNSRINSDASSSSYQQSSYAAAKALSEGFLNGESAKNSEKVANSMDFSGISALKMGLESFSSSQHQSAISCANSLTSNRNVGEMNSNIVRLEDDSKDSYSKKSVKNFNVKIEPSIEDDSFDDSDEVYDDEGVHTPSKNHFYSTPWPQNDVLLMRRSEETVLPSFPVGVAEAADANGVGEEADFVRETSKSLPIKKEPVVVYELSGLYFDLRSELRAENLLHMKPSSDFKANSTRDTHPIGDATLLESLAHDASRAPQLGRPSYTRYNDAAFPVENLKSSLDANYQQDFAYISHDDSRKLQSGASSEHTHTMQTRPSNTLEALSREADLLRLATFVRDYSIHPNVSPTAFQAQTAHTTDYKPLDVNRQRKIPEDEKGEEEFPQKAIEYPTEASSTPEAAQNFVGQAEIRAAVELGVSSMPQFLLYTNKGKSLTPGELEDETIRKKPESSPSILPDDPGGGESVGTPLLSPDAPVVMMDEEVGFSAEGRNSTAAAAVCARDCKSEAHTASLGGSSPACVDAQVKEEGKINRLLVSPSTSSIEEATKLDGASKLTAENGYNKRDGSNTIVFEKLNVHQRQSAHTELRSQGASSELERPRLRGLSEDERVKPSPVCSSEQTQEEGAITHTSHLPSSSTLEHQSPTSQRVIISSAHTTIDDQYHQFFGSTQPRDGDFSSKDVFAKRERDFAHSDEDWMSKKVAYSKSGQHEEEIFFEETQFSSITRDLREVPIALLRSSFKHNFDDLYSHHEDSFDIQGLSSVDSVYAHSIDEESGKIGGFHPLSAQPRSFSAYNGFSEAAIPERLLYPPKRASIVSLIHDLSGRNLAKASVPTSSYSSLDVYNQKIAQDSGRSKDLKILRYFARTMRDRISRSQNVFDSLYPKDLPFYEILQKDSSYVVPPHSSHRIAQEASSNSLAHLFKDISKHGGNSTGYEKYLHDEDDRSNFKSRYHPTVSLQAHLAAYLQEKLKQAPPDWYTMSVIPRKHQLPDLLVKKSPKSQKGPKVATERAPKKTSAKAQQLPQQQQANAASSQSFSSPATIVRSPGFSPNLLPPHDKTPQVQAPPLPATPNTSRGAGGRFNQRRQPMASSPRSSGGGLLPQHQQQLDPSSTAKSAYSNPLPSGVTPQTLDQRGGQVNTSHGGVASPTLLRYSPLVGGGQAAMLPGAFPYNATPIAHTSIPAGNPASNMEMSPSLSVSSDSASGGNREAPSRRKKRSKAAANAPRFKANNSSIPGDTAQQVQHVIPLQVNGGAPVAAAAPTAPGAPVTSVTPMTYMLPQLHQADLMGANNRRYTQPPQIMTASGPNAVMNSYNLSPPSGAASPGVNGAAPYGYYDSAFLLPPQNFGGGGSLIGHLHQQPQQGMSPHFISDSSHMQAQGAFIGGAPAFSSHQQLHRGGNMPGLGISFLPTQSSAPYHLSGAPRREFKNLQGGMMPAVGMGGRSPHGTFTGGGMEYHHLSANPQGGGGGGGNGGGGGGMLGGAPFGLLGGDPVSLMGVHGHAPIPNGGFIPVSLMSGDDGKYFEYNAAVDGSKPLSMHAATALSQNNSGLTHVKLHPQMQSVLNNSHLPFTFLPFASSANVSQASSHPMVVNVGLTQMQQQQAATLGEVPLHMQR